MKQGIWKHAPVIMVVAAMAFSFYALKKILSSPDVPKTAENLSYEMPRPKSVEGGYDLSGRQVVRDIRSLPPKVKPAPPAPAKVAGVVQVDPKKLKAEQDKKKAEEAKKKALAAAAAAKKKAQMSVAVTPASTSKMKGFDENTGAQAPAANSNSGSGFSDPNITVDATPDLPEKKNKMTIGQWRSLLMSKPSLANGTAFVNAYHKNEIDAVGFYQVSEELLKDSNADKQKLAVAILRQDTSVRSFSVLTAHYTDKTNEAVKTEIYEALKSYGEASKFSILNKILLSPDNRVAQMGTQILSQVVAAQSAQGSTQTAMGRDARSPGSSPIPASQFQGFIPTLKRLAASSNESLSQEAQKLLDSIQTLVGSSAETSKSP